MYKAKLWNEDVITEGGLSFIKDEETSRVYKVSMTNKSNDVVYKWKFIAVFHFLLRVLSLVS